VLVAALFVPAGQVAFEVDESGCGLGRGLAGVPFPHPARGIGRRHAPAGHLARDRLDQSLFGEVGKFRRVRLRMRPEHGVEQLIRDEVGHGACPQRALSGFGEQQALDLGLGLAGLQQPGDLLDLAGAHAGLASNARGMPLIVSRKASRGTAPRLL